MLSGAGEVGGADGDEDDAGALGEFGDPLGEATIAIDDQELVQRPDSEVACRRPSAGRWPRHRPRSTRRRSGRVRRYPLAASSIAESMNAISWSRGRSAKNRICSSAVSKPLTGLPAARASVVRTCSTLAAGSYPALTIGRTLRVSPTIHGRNGSILRLRGAVGGKQGVEAGLVLAGDLGRQRPGRVQPILENQGLEGRRISRPHSGFPDRARPPPGAPHPCGKSATRVRA